MRKNEFLNINDHSNLDCAVVKILSKVCITLGSCLLNVKAFKTYFTSSLRLFLTEDSRYNGISVLTNYFLTKKDIRL